MEKLQVYKCEKCGNIVTVFNVGGGELVCCGQPMALLKENTTDADREKHVPVIEKNGPGFKVRVGSAEHPMEDKHYIQWIELLADGKSCVQFLSPGAGPEAVFNVEADKTRARAYCNLHGLWQAGQD